MGAFNVQHQSAAEVLLTAQFLQVERLRPSEGERLWERQALESDPTGTVPAGLRGQSLPPVKEARELGTPPGVGLS